MATKKIRVLRDGVPVQGKKRQAGYECEYPAHAAQKLALSGAVEILHPSHSLADSVAQAQAAEDDVGREGSEADEEPSEVDEQGGAADGEVDADEGGQSARSEIEAALEADDWNQIQDALGAYTDLAPVGTSKDDAVESLNAKLEELD